jgi:hypothetical protein
VFSPDSAKDIAMMDSSEKGQQVRAYYRKCEEVVKEVIELTTSQIKDMLIEAQERDILELKTKKRQIAGGKGGITKDRNRWKRKATELDMYRVASEKSTHWSTYSGSKQLASLCNEVMDSDYEWYEIEEMLCDMNYQELHDGVYYVTTDDTTLTDGHGYGRNKQYNNWHLVLTTVAICKHIQG